MNIFYTPNINPTDSTYQLNNVESKHAIKVLRLKIGDELALVDGIGNFYQAEIMDDNHKKCMVNIIAAKKEDDPSFALHIAIAPTKNNDRMEWFIEKATEIGISEISFIICDHSERKVLKTDRLKKRAIAAMKQSLKATLPIINEPLNFKEFLRLANQTNGYIAYCDEITGKNLLKRAYPEREDCVILIGPEGDFSANEVESAIATGFKPVSLGNSRLRTETAGIVACHTINLINE